MTGGPTRVVMIGGGYATLHACRALLRRRTGAEVQVTVVSADDCHNFHGFTGEVVAGLLPQEITRTPLTDVLGRAVLIHGEVISVDPVRRTVLVRPMRAAAPQLVPYDELVVASGAREPVDAVPGMAEHGFTLRAPGQFGRFLNRLSVVAETGSAGLPRRRSVRGCSVAAGDTAASVVITGGGMAGVELAAAVADRLKSTGARNPVVLVQSGETVLSELRRHRPAVAAQADRELGRLGVRVRTSERVTAVHADRVTLSDGSQLLAAAVLATNGQRPNALPGLESLPHDRLGRLVTDGNLSVAPGIWAAGDAARVAHPTTGEPVPANALWAIKAGGHLGRNLSRVTGNRRPRAFGYRGLGQAMGFGIGRSATELYGVPINGAAGWILRLAFFLRFMPSRRRAVSVLGSLMSLPIRGRFVAHNADSAGRSGASAQGDRHTVGAGTAA